VIRTRPTSLTVQALSTCFTRKQCKSYSRASRHSPEHSVTSTPQISHSICPMPQVLSASSPQIRIPARTMVRAGPPKV
jgi:hypothetical protein